MKNTTKKATVNFLNMYDNVFTMLSNCQLHINELASLEVATDNKKAALKKAGKAGEALKEALKDERKAEKEARQRTTDYCTAFIIRHMTVEDVTAKDFDIYHINWDGFLQQIGVVSDGELDKKATEKIRTITAKAVDRYKVSAAGRKRGTDRFAEAERKEVKNNIIDLVSAFIYAAVDSGAIEYCGGGLAKKDFGKKEEPAK